MFNEREMSKAIDWLFELFSPEDYEGYDEDEIGYAGGLCLPEVCTALRLSLIHISEPTRP